MTPPLEKIRPHPPLRDRVPVVFFSPPGAKHTGLPQMTSGFPRLGDDGHRGHGCDSRRGSDRGAHSRDSAADSSEARG